MFGVCDLSCDDAVHLRAFFFSDALPRTQSSTSHQVIHSACVVSLQLACADEFYKFDMMCFSLSLSKGQQCAYVGQYVPWEF